MHTSLNSADRLVVVGIDFLPHICDSFVTLKVDSLAGRIKKHFVGAAACVEDRYRFTGIGVQNQHFPRLPPFRLRGEHTAPYKKPMMSAVKRKRVRSLALRCQ